MRTRSDMVAAIAFIPLVCCTPKQSIPDQVNEPDESVLCRPVFEYDDRPPESEAMGFMIRTPDGRIAAVTVSDVMISNQIRRVVWHEAATGEKIETFVRSWGPPGEGGNDQPIHADLRRDYFIFPVTAAISTNRLLELDDRSKPAEEENVWLPVLDPDAPGGFACVPGYLEETHLKYHVLILQRPVTGTPLVGTPVISQITGRVVGMVSINGENYGRMLLGRELAGQIFLLTPTSAVTKAIKAHKPDFEIRRIGNLPP